MHGCVGGRCERGEMGTSGGMLNSESQTGSGRSEGGQRRHSSGGGSEARNPSGEGAGVGMKGGPRLADDKV